MNMEINRLKRLFFLVEGRSGIKIWENLKSLYIMKVYSYSRSVKSVGNNLLTICVMTKRLAEGER